MQRKSDPYWAEQFGVPRQPHEQEAGKDTRALPSSRRGAWAVGLSVTSLLAYLLAWAADDPNEILPTWPIVLGGVWFLTGIAALIVVLYAVLAEGKGPRDRKLGLLGLGLLLVNVLVVVLSIYA